MPNKELAEFAESMIKRFDRQEGMMMGMRTDQQQTTKELVGVRVEVVEMKTKIDEVASKIEGVEKKVAENKKNILETQNELKDVKQAVFSEVNDIEAKRSNLIVFGVPEQNETENRDQAREKDTRAIESIIEAIAGEKKAFNLRFRIGKKQEDKPRPILIKVIDLKEKEEILGKIHNLKGHAVWDKIYIKHDLTRLQREHLKQLNEKLSADADLRNQGLKNEDFRWVVRGRGMQRHLAKSKNVRD